MVKTLFQASTWNALALGNFDTVISVRELLRCADTGVGIGTALDGVITFENGAAYKTAPDGEVTVMRPEDSMAFAAAMVFDENAPEIALNGIDDLTSLKQMLAPFVQGNPNLFYMIKAGGVFKTSETAILHDAGEDGNSVSDMVSREISELHDEAEEAAEYSVDLSKEPETVPSESTPISSTEESDWGFQEPKKEIAEEKVIEPALEASVPAGPSKIAPKSDRQLFYELKFNNLDRGLTPEERQEWNSIYASYRGRSAITGTIIGVDPHSIYVWNPETERREKKTMYCAIVVPYRVRIVIPASEMWEAGNERPDYVLQNMVGASIDLVIIKVEREAGFAIGSRRLASRSQRYFFAHREDLHRIGSRVKCRMLAVGPRRCLVDCYGHDLDLTQREMRYAAIPDLRDEYHPGMELESVVKVYDPAKDELVVSIKETETNPILGAEQRHPVGSRRLAVISGKYGGGVFCNLPDGVVCMCNYSFQHEDSDFMVGENVMLVVQRYNEEKLQMFGKILSKW